MPKGFFLTAHALKTKIPPDPPLTKGGTTGNCFSGPPLEKGDLGGFKNQHVE
jgi:hypothetical protein